MYSFVWAVKLLSFVVVLYTEGHLLSTLSTNHAGLYWKLIWLLKLLGFLFFFWLLLFLLLSSFLIVNIDL